jgi:hypothetical protein
VVSPAACRLSATRPRLSRSDVYRRTAESARAAVPAGDASRAARSPPTLSDTLASAPASPAALAGGSGGTTVPPFTLA